MWTIDAVGGAALIWLGVTTVPLVALADEDVVALADEDVIRATLKSAMPSLLVDSIAPSPVEGIFEVASLRGDTTDVIYIASDGSHFFTGDLVLLQETGPVNVSKQREDAARRIVLEQLDVADMVVFAPGEGTKAILYVLTDVDCGYCRRFHDEVADLTTFGVEVRYLAFPRAGIGSPTYQKMVSAWCSNDRKLALSRLKVGEPVKDQTCESPVARHYAIGQRLGVRGTPALIVQDGRIIGGYRSATEIAKELGIQSEWFMER